MLLLLACTEYDISGTKNPPGAQDSNSTDVDTGTPDTTVDACAGEEARAIDVVLNDACDVPPATGTFVPVVKWSIPGHNGYGPPVVAQIDDDNGDGVVDSLDMPDVLWVSNLGEGVICADGQTGTIKWISRAATDPVSGLAVGDINGDGDMEIVVANGPSSIVVMDELGNRVWQAAVNNGQLFDFLYPAIADMDGDGKAEIIAGRNILSWNGQLLGTGNKGVGAVPNQSGYYIEGAVPAVVDLNGDGLLEVVTGNAAYNIDGTILYQNNGDDGCPAVADMDGDGEPEVVMVTGNRVYTLESDLSLTGWSDSFPNTNYIGPPAIDDLDGDGEPDFVVEGSGEMRAYHWNGRRIWTQQVQDQSGAAGPILFDFEQDGYPEVVYADEEWVRVFDGRTGAVKMVSGDHESYTGFETPIVADVDNDGHVEIVMLHGQSVKGITVYSDQNNSWPPGRQIWNQHAYSITNVNPDGSIPRNQQPNWATYNNYRSGDAGAAPSTWEDVSAELVDVCVKECPDTLELVARVWNQGTEEVPAGLSVAVRAGAGGAVVATATIPDAIPSGRSSAGVTLVVATADLGRQDPWLEVDTDGGGFGQIQECDESNNGVTVTDTCP